MNLQEYSQMYEVESSHWYFAGKRAVLERLLKHVLGINKNHRLLDVGCGTGIVLVMLEQFGEATGVDASDVALEFCKRRGLTHLHKSENETELPFSDQSFDVITAFDLLEHLDQDLKLLMEMKRVCSPGGTILLTVPAHPFLWSEHDTALHHKRRYTKKQFRSLIKDAGLKCHRMTYINSFLFPVAIIYRSLRNLLPRKNGEAKSEFFVQLPASVNRLLFSIFSLESRLIPKTNLPVGLSILGLCEKV